MLALCTEILSLQTDC